LAIPIQIYSALVKQTHNCKTAIFQL